jgi:hypothetical protein
LAVTLLSRLPPAPDLLLSAKDLFLAAMLANCFLPEINDEQ